MRDDGQPGSDRWDLRVVDCSVGMAGPLAAMQLADFGAEVIKVEPPGGDPGRASPGFAYWNRNKQGIVLDFAASDGRAELETLLAAADGCVFSQALAELEPLGLDPEAVTKRHPALVYLHAPPYVASGPGSDLPESLGLLSAVTGVAQFQYSTRAVPVDPVIPHVLTLQGMWGAGAMLAAFYERMRSGLGQSVRVGGLQGVLAAAGGLFTQLVGVDPGRPLGNPGGKLPNYQLYEASEGLWFFLGALTPAFRVAAFGVLGVLDGLLADPRIEGELAAVGLPENLGWVRDRIAEVVRTRPRDAWLEELRAAGVPVEPVLSREAWLAHPQIESMGALVAVDDREHGPTRIPGFPLDMPAWPAMLRSPAPALGEHNGRIVPRPAPAEQHRDRNGVDAGSREHFGRPAGSQSTAAGDSPRAPGPLEGVRVLDLGGIIAGPYIGGLLADLGADVIKVEPLSGDTLRASGITFVGYNLGKRGVALDLRAPEGLEALYALVKRADIVIDNFRPGVLERLRVDYRSLSAINPRIICVSVTGFGDDGPLGGRPGFDPLLQAMSGMMLAQGGAGQPVFYTIPVHDVGASATAATGVILALIQRRSAEQGGSVPEFSGQCLRTSLAGVSLNLQPAESVQYAGRLPAPVGGPDFAGPSALDRHYEVADGWVRIQAEDDEAIGRLIDAGLIDDATVARGDGEVAGALGRWLRSFTRGEAIGLLATCGVRAVPSRNVVELPDAPELVAEHALELAVSPLGQAIWTTGNYARFSRTERSGAKLPPGLGEHTVEVLEEAGLAEATIEKLLAKGIAYAGTPFSLPG